MSEHHVVVDPGVITTITLDRPHERNALSSAMIARLTEALEAVGRSDALGIVIAANGPVFSSGHHFGEMAGVDEAAAHDLFDRCTAMMRLVQSVPQPVCAKVHGLATAAGCQLVATCDLAVASEDAGFALPGGKGGLFCHTPVVAVARTIGRKRALELAFSGDVVDARTAADWGLVNHVVPADELDAAVDDLMRRVTRGSAHSKALGKQAFYAQAELPDADAYDIAVDVMSAAVVDADAQEGIAAFLAKRHPEFRDRPRAG